MKTLVVFLTFFALNAMAEEPKANVRYEYKKFEKFDFEEIGVEGEAGSPGDISISPRLRKEFRNKLPERQNFNKEMQKAINGIR
jgi:peroxiredoxin family protein